jgi:hypothetical protein
MKNRELAAMLMKRPDDEASIWVAEDPDGDLTKEPIFLVGSLPTDSGIDEDIAEAGGLPTDLVVGQRQWLCLTTEGDAK